MRQSISRRLNSRLFWRLVGIYLSLDILLCLLTAGGLVYFGEQRADAAARIVSEAGLPERGDADWLTLSSVVVGMTRGDDTGVSIPKPFSYVLPDSTRSGTRAVVTTGDTAFFKWMDGLSYVVTVDIGAAGTNAAAYRISVAFGPFMQIFRILMIVLLAYELFAILSKTGKNRQMVRRELDPITALTRAAISLNAVSKQLDTDKMAALAGKLEGIDAARLDTRIVIDDTQEELKSLARAINGMLDRINESYRAQIRFVSDASHELRTPISVIQGYANLLDRWGKNDEKTLQESINAIKDETANMKDLVEQLLFLARGDNDTIMLQPETFDLTELAREVTGEFSMIDATHNFELKAGTAMICADRGLIKQALRILVDNAVKYTDPGGHITLATAGEGATAAVSVSDDGIGIKAEAVGHIFERFYRADDSRARATGGAGLGLSIAHWIAAKHNGHMEVLSREGIGTRISVVLPASLAPYTVLRPQEDKTKQLPQEAKEAQDVQDAQDPPEPPAPPQEQPMQELPPFHEMQTLILPKVHPDD